MRQESLYVLRLWRDGDHSDAWRASLEDLRSKEKTQFSSFADLCRFLEDLCGVESAKDGDEE